MVVVAVEVIRLFCCCLNEKKKKPVVLCHIIISYLYL